jgi:hypothetical protein
MELNVWVNVQALTAGDIAMVTNTQIMLAHLRQSTSGCRWQHMLGDFVSLAVAANAQAPRGCLT